MPPLINFRAVMILLLCFISIYLFLQISLTTENQTKPRNNDSNVIVSFMPRAGLGNVVCEYVHLLHTNVTFSKEAFIHPKMHRILMKLFESFPLPLLPASSQKLISSRYEVEYSHALAELEAGLPLPPYLLLTGTPCRVSLVWSIRDYWRDKLVFKPSLKINAEKRLAQLLQENVRDWSMNKSKAVVGVHVRRGDFTSVLKRHYGSKKLLPPSYYHSAFNYYRQRFGREVIFFVLTEKNERNWCRKFLSSSFDDVIVVDDDASASQDLVQLSMFRYIIYSYGTFGLWAVLLSDARTVVYPDKASDAGLKRYSHHVALDFISDKVPATAFETVSF